MTREEFHAALIELADRYTAARHHELVEQLVKGLTDGTSTHLQREKTDGALQGALHLDVHDRPRRARRKGRRAKAPRVAKGKPVSPDPARARAARRDDDDAATAVTSKGQPRQRAVMKCGKCGEPGKRSDGCGKTHNVDGADVATPPASNPPPITCRQVRANRGPSPSPRARRAMVTTTRSLLS